ncbi:GntR family transcriptional regulator [Sporolactobacillus sp. THM7-4]|nr:GntR family transcriptional regulator [Sporolactobacillus sp. THM7-4]
MVYQNSGGRNVADWNVDQIIPMREHVYRYLKDLILEGTYQAGDRLIERDLAKEMNISRTPVREALFRLEAQGLVKTVPRKGVVVEKISKQQITEIFDILSVLEGLACRLAACRINRETAESCEKQIQRIRAFLAEYQKEDIELFHMSVCDFIYKAAKSRKLYLMLTDLTDYIRVFARAGYRKDGRFEEAMTEHMHILEAIKQGNAQAAEERAADHIRRSKFIYLTSAHSD